MQRRLGVWAYSLIVVTSVILCLETAIKMFFFSSFVYTDYNGVSQADDSFIVTDESSALGSSTRHKLGSSSVQDSLEPLLLPLSAATAVYTQTTMRFATAVLLVAALAIILAVAVY
jgi:hypothetical protein